MNIHIYMEKDTSKYTNTNGGSDTRATRTFYVDSATHSFIHSVIHSFIHSLTHSSAQWHSASGCSFNLKAIRRFTSLLPFWIQRVRVHINMNVPCLQSIYVRVFIFFLCPQVRSSFPGFYNVERCRKSIANNRKRRAFP